VDLSVTTPQGHHSERLRLARDRTIRVPSRA
jgi:hypothetical protein